MSGPGSVSFDRAADYYDRTRGLSAEGARRTIGAPGGGDAAIGAASWRSAWERASSRCRSTRRASRWSDWIWPAPMLDRLVEKMRGRVPVPLVQGDATRLPFATGSFGAAYFRWVLHLIPSWQDGRRGARAGRASWAATIVASLGTKGSGPRAEIHEHFAQAAGQGSIDPAGLDWED